MTPEDNTANSPMLLKMVFGLSLFLTAVLGYWFYSYQQEQMQREVESDLAAIAKLKIGQIGQWRKERLGDANVLSEDQHIRATWKKWLEHPSPELAKTIRDRLASLIKHYGFSNALLCDSEGKVLLAMREHSPHLFESEKNQFTAVFEKGHGKVDISDFYLNDEGEPRISVVIPLVEVAATVILVFDPTQVLYPLIKTWPTPSETAETLLVRKEGNNVLFLNDLLHKGNAALKFKIPLKNYDLPATKAILGHTGPVVGKDYRNVEVIAHLQPVPSTNWFMVAKEDAVEAFAVWRSRSALLLALLVGLVTLMISLVYVHWQRSEKNYFENLYRFEANLRVKESRFGVILKSIGDAVVSTDERGFVELLNPVAEELTGWTTKEAAGKVLDEVFDIKNADTGERAENPVTHVLREGGAIGLANHTILTSRSGVERTIADSAAPIIDDNGELSGVVLVFRDVTERERQERALREQERILNVTGHMAKIGGWEHDLKTGKALWTNALYDIIEIEKSDEPPGTSEHLSYYPEKDREILSQAYERAIEEGIPFDLELQVNTSKGKLLWCRAVGVPAYSDAEVTKLFGTFQDITERKETELALAESERRMSTLLSNLPGMVYRCKNTPQWPMDFISEGVKELTGYGPSGFLSKELSFQDLILPEYQDYIFDEVQKAIKEERYFELTYKIAHKDGSHRWVWERGQFVAREGDEEWIEGIITDISEQKEFEQVSEKLQEQLVQSQKMEAVGRLAGGVAHDFNNMLLVILGNTDCLLEDLSEDSPIREELTEIQDAAERSAALTKQLLAFARRQAAEPRVLDVNVTMGKMLSMLRRLIGEDIVLSWRPGEAVWPTRIDPAQLDQLLANLCINARHAIEDTGEVIIETSNCSFDEKDIEPFTQQGDFTLISVSDTGCGMDEETKERAFEPFFSNNSKNGTGLGLATVYGIVKQNNGHIHLYSELGKGTTFKIFLPRCLEEAEELVEEESGDIPRGNGEMILLVEDEESVINLSRRTLEKLGYTVIAETEPKKAIELAKKAEHPIDLLVTDVIMPDLNGRQLREQLEEFLPHLKSIYISGYTADIIAKRGVIEEGVQFLSKPFSRRALATKIREILDEA